MNFDYSKLKGKIKEVFGTQVVFAEAMGLSSVSVSDKLNNKTSWTQTEIQTACDILDIKPAEIPIYFFTVEVKVA